MKVFKNKNNRKEAPIESKFPKILHRYKNDNFSLQLKTRTFYNICIVAIIAVAILILSSTIVQLNIPSNRINWHILIPLISILIVFFISLVLLIKGYFTFAANIFMVSANLTVWYIMFVSSNSLIVVKLDTIVMILAIINVIPLFITKYKSTVFIYVIANIILLILFVQHFKDILPIDKASVIDFLSDTIIALLFSGFAAYQIVRINNKSLAKLEYDYEKRIKAEKALTTSQKLFQILAEAAPVGIFRTKPDGYTTYVNPKWCELSGLNHDEATGDGWLKAVHPDDRHALSMKWSIDSKKGIKSVAEYRFIKPNGDIVWVLGNTVPEMEDEEILGFIGTITDITKLKYAEQELKESELRYRGIFEDSQVGIYQTSPEGEILKANPALLQMLGFNTVKDLTERNLNRDEVFVNKTRDNFKQEIEKSGIIKDYESEWLKKNGETLNILENARIVRDEKGGIKYYEGFVIDITEKKKIEKELDTYREDLEHLVQERTDELATTNEELTSTNEELLQQREELQTVLLNLQKTQKQLIESEKMASLGVLASGIAHEINNPLNFIKGGAFGIEQYINNELKEHKTELKPLIDGINIGIDRAANIVKSLNHYSRKNNLDIAQCDIDEIINDSLIILQNQINNNIIVNRDYSSKSYILLGNEGKLHQALLNILSNAVHAIDEEGEIDVATKVDRNNLIITIKDNGCGIKKENISRIFDPFYTTKEAGVGTGLGLSITYNIIKDHKGTIEVSSQVNKGSEFKIILPLQKK